MWTSSCMIIVQFQLVEMFLGRKNASTRLTCVSLSEAWVLFVVFMHARITNWNLQRKHYDAWFIIPPTQHWLSRQILSYTKQQFRHGITKHLSNGCFVLLPTRYAFEVFKQTKLLPVQRSRCRCLWGDLFVRNRIRSTEFAWGSVAGEAARGGFGVSR